MISRGYTIAGHTERGHNIWPRSNLEPRNYRLLLSCEPVEAGETILTGGTNDLVHDPVDGLTGRVHRDADGPNVHIVCTQRTGGNVIGLVDAGGVGEVHIL